MIVSFAYTWPVVFVILYCLLIAPPALIVAKPIRVGVIGGGIGGSAFSYFLRQWLNETSSTTSEVSIELLEKSNRIGGRAMTVTIDGFNMEGGASIFHHTNEYLRNLSLDLNLSIGTPEKIDNGIGIWNFTAHQFMIHLGTNTIFSFLQLIWRYGYSFFQLKKDVDGIANKFYRFYPLQQQGHSYLTPDDLLAAVDLYNATQGSLVDFLNSKHLSFNQKLLYELITAAIHVNYNQEVTVNLLAGGVGLTPLMDQRFFAILSGGNQALVQRLLERSLAKVFKQQTVQSIQKMEGGEGEGYLVQGINNAGEAFSKQYDIVVIAAPLSQSAIKVGHRSWVGKHPYTRTVATFVCGTINPHYFGYSSIKDLPGNIMTTTCYDNQGQVTSCLFTSLNLYFVNKTTGHSVYKIFSGHLINETILHQLFTVIEFVEADWLAYPTFYSVETFIPFKLSIDGEDGAKSADSIYYSSAFENAVSCMECMTVSAKNAMLLVRQDIESRLALHQEQEQQQADADNPRLHHNEL